MATSFDMNRPVRIFGKNEHPVLDLLGPTVQFFTTPEEAGEEFCVLKSTIPPGAFVPIHSHADVECFYMLSGQQEILIEEDGRFRWTVCRSGDFVDLPSSVKHAFRTRSQSD